VPFGAGNETPEAVELEITDGLPSCAILPRHSSGGTNGSGQSNAEADPTVGWSTLVSGRGGFMEKQERLEARARIDIKKLYIEAKSL